MRQSKLLNPRVLAVMENEWAQLIRNKVVIFTTLVPPFLLVLLALAVLLLSSYVGMDAIAAGKNLPGGITTPTVSPPLIGNDDSLRAALLSPFLLLFQMIPLVVPITVSSYSIVGEKQSRSLEALLATPIRTWELLMAKALAAAIPGVVATWFSFGIFLFAARFAVSDALYHSLILSPTWLLGILVLSPLFTLLAVGLGIIISSRVKDPNSAQQLGSLVILPVMGLLAGQVAGAVAVDATLIIEMALFVGLADVAIMFTAIRLFRREAILTTWR